MSDQRTTLTGSVDGARMLGHRLWLGALLLVVPNALDCITNVLVDDQRASDELLSAEDWLLSSAQRLPQGMKSVQLLRLLSTLETLNGFQ